MNSTVANDQLFNASLALGTTGTYTFTNDSTTNSLTIAGGISASSAGTKVLSVTGSGNTTISVPSPLAPRHESVQVRHWHADAFCGGALAAGNHQQCNKHGFRIASRRHDQDHSGTYTSTGEFVIGGVLSNGGAGVNTNLTMDGGSLTASKLVFRRQRKTASAGCPPIWCSTTTRRSPWPIFPPLEWQ